MTRTVATHRDSVLAEVSGKAPRPIVDGEVSAVLHVGAGFGGVVLVVQHCGQGRGHRETYNISAPSNIGLSDNLTPQHPAPLDTQTLNNAKVGLKLAFAKPEMLN